MRIVPALLLVLTLAGLPSCKFIQNKIFNKKALAAAAELKVRADSIRVADSLRKVEELQIAAENARLDSIRIAEEKRKASESKYNIIVGSFLTPEYAKLLNEEYSKKGYPSQIIKMDDGRFNLVAVEGHKSLKKAIARLAAFQDTVQIDSWIYMRK